MKVKTRKTLAERGKGAGGGREGGGDAMKRNERLRDFVGLLDHRRPYIHPLTFTPLHSRNKRKTVTMDFFLNTVLIPFRAIWSHHSLSGVVAAGAAPF